MRFKPKKKTSKNTMHENLLEKDRKIARPWCLFAIFFSELDGPRYMAILLQVGEGIPHGCNAVWQNYSLQKQCNKSGANCKVDWLVVSTHLKNISQNGNLPQIGVKIKHIWNHHLDDLRLKLIRTTSCWNLPLYPEFWRDKAYINSHIEQCSKHL